MYSHKAVILWSMFQQRQMQDLKRKSTEELKAFVEISCTTSPNHLVSVRKAYCLLLNSSLAEYTGSYIHFPPATVFVFWYHTF